jgi:hypothetical protein
LDDVFGRLSSFLSVQAACNEQKSRVYPLLIASFVDRTRGAPCELRPARVAFAVRASVVLRFVIRFVLRFVIRFVLRLLLYFALRRTFILLADADEQHSPRAIPPACRPRGCACHQGWCSVDRFGAGWQPRQDPAPRAQSK